jgi:gamma-glutamylcysteine synthetase
MRTKSVSLTSIEDYYNSRFRDSLSPSEVQVGVESEFPLINLKTGKAVSPKVAEKVFQAFVKKGWDPVIDQGTGALVSVEKIINDYTVTFGTDVGRSIIEIALPPAKNLFQVVDYRKDIIEPIVAEFKKNNAALLGYGILPHEKPHRNLIAQKGRYHFFEADSSNTFVPPEDGVDLHVFALTASSQTHIQVARKDAARLLNVMNCLSGLFVLLGANAPVWQGKQDPDNCRAVREWLWEAGWPTRANQVALLRPMNSITDYINTVLSFRPQMIKRDEYLSLRFAGFTNRELFEKGYITATTVKGEKVHTHMKPEDIVFMGGFAWYNARLTGFGTVETRVVCQQPPKEPYVMSALILGLGIMLDETEALVNKQDFIFWKEFRLSAMYRGFKDTKGLHLAEKALKIAINGLKKRGFGEEIFLEPIEKRLSDQKAPAERILSTFKKKGIEGLIEASVI